MADDPRSFVRIETMASGKLALRFGEEGEIDWQIFPRFADNLVARHGWEVKDRGESPLLLHLWTVEIDGVEFWLSWDDVVGAGLESPSEDASAMIPAIAARIFTDP